MKRTVFIAAVLLFVASFAFAESSPDRAHVKIVSVPRECLEQGTFENSTTKWTCNKVDSSEVWNDVELLKFEKDIFEAYSQPKDVTRIGLVVKQDSTYTRPMTDERKEVALVERRDGYKYRYSRK